MKPIHIIQTKTLMTLIHWVDFSFLFSTERDLAVDGTITLYEFSLVFPCGSQN